MFVKTNSFGFQKAIAAKLKNQTFRNKKSLNKKLNNKCSFQKNVMVS